MIEEKPFFFRTGARPLYGVIYNPAGDGSGRGLVICDSLFEEKFWCERVFANMGRRLAGKGFTVLSFDYYGYGSSGGGSADVTVSGLEEDVGAACDFLRSQGIGGISLLGIKWGAALACRVAAARDDVDSVFLINPIDNWKSQLMKTLRANITGQYAIFKKAVITREKIVEELLAGKDCVRAGYRMNNIDGYVISKGFFEQGSEVVIPDGLPEHVRSVTVVTIPEKQSNAARKESPVAAKIAAAGTAVEDLFLGEDNAFWFNNRIFTSVTPALYAEIERVLEALPAPQKAQGSGFRGTEAVDTCVIDGVRETALTLKTGRGYDLFAVLYLPEEGETKEEGFVFTHGGLIGLNGAFRFNTRGARRLAKKGYPSICCDTRGMGRSQGTIENMEQRILFRKVCTGFFAPDVESAAEYLKKNTPVRRVAPLGVCGGAISNVLAQSGSKNIDESVLLSVPVMLPSLDYKEVRMSEGYARFYLGMFRSKIFSPKAWLRLLTGKSDTARIFKSIRIIMAGFVAKVFGGNKRDAGSEEKATQNQQTAGSGADGSGRQVKGGLSVIVPGAGDDLQFNFAFLDAYRKIVRRGERLYFVFGEHDNFRWEFNSEFVEGMPEEYAAGKDYIKVEEIPHANHMYTLREWQDTIIDHCMQWADSGKSN